MDEIGFKYLRNCKNLQSYSRNTFCIITASLRHLKFLLNFVSCCYNIHQWFHLLSLERGWIIKQSCHHIVIAFGNGSGDLLSWYWQHWSVPRRTKRTDDDDDDEDGDDDDDDDEDGDDFWCLFDNWRWWWGGSAILTSPLWPWSSWANDGATATTLHQSDYIDSRETWRNLRG